MNSSLLGSGETLCSAFYIHPPTLIFAETRCRRGGGEGIWGAFYKKKTCAGSGGLASPRPTSTPGSQIFGAFVRAPRHPALGFQPCLENQSHKSSLVPHLRPSQPHRRNPRPRRPSPNVRLASRPRGPQGGAREATTKGLRLPRRAWAAAPARQPQTHRPAPCAPRPDG